LNCFKSTTCVIARHTVNFSARASHREQLVRLFEPAKLVLAERAQRRTIGAGEIVADGKRQIFQAGSCAGRRIVRLR
jgi:hypothetical protein